MPLMKHLFPRKKSKSRSSDGNNNLAQDDREEPGNLQRVFKELDCPVCFNTCVPPIHSCINGHIICNNCRKNVLQCPSCRKGFTGTRNFFAENFVTNCSQRCRYAEEGCEFLRLKGENLQPHEAKCMFRPISCLVPTCGEEVPYKSLLTHLTMDHKVSGTDALPANITFQADTPIINNRKWLPYIIEAHENIFYVMMEVVRPHFWVWVWLQTIKTDDAFEYFFTSHIAIKNSEKKLKLTWEGPVHTIRTSEKTIMKEGLCFVAHECFLQHFNAKGHFKFTVDINKFSRTASTHAEPSTANNTSLRPDDPNFPDRPSTGARLEMNLSRLSKASEMTLYDRRLLRELPESSFLNEPNLTETIERNDSFASKASDADDNCPTQQRPEG